jgi:hypothetical protein
VPALLSAVLLGSQLQALPHQGRNSKECDLTKPAGRYVNRAHLLALVLGRVRVRETLATLAAKRIARP